MEGIIQQNLYTPTEKQLLRGSKMDNNILEILIFNVGQAQCIFFYPRSNPEYGMLVDCGSGEDYDPTDFLVEKGFFHRMGGINTLSNLTLTNYDHDHFSGLPKLRQNVFIQTVSLPQNISSTELKSIKPEITNALQNVCYLKDTYTTPAPYHTPPYSKYLYSLTQDELGMEAINTNHLSQLVFIEYGGSKICIGGDLERNPAWGKILQKTEIQNHLRSTNVVVAAHHGHDNGYHEDIFLHCLNPDCIVISDKDIIYDTQDGMASIYSKHVPMGIALNGANPARKVLTTRSDGHLWISFYTNGARTYQSFSIN